MRNNPSQTRAGVFAIAKSIAYIRGRDRKTRVLTFTTTDGYVGESRSFNHDEAYEAAMAKRTEALFAKATLCPKSPAPVPAFSLTTVDESTLFSEIERRGYEVCVPDSPLAMLAGAVEAHLEAR